MACEALSKLMSRDHRAYIAGETANVVAKQETRIQKNMFESLMRLLGFKDDVIKELSSKYNTSNTIKDQLPALLKNHIDKIPNQHMKEIGDFVKWVKDPSHKTLEQLKRDADTAILLRQMH